MGSKDRLYADIMAVNPEVTGSCNLVIVKQPDNSTVKFVVDCGLFQERQYSKNNESLPFIPANIDFCLVTHNQCGPYWTPTFYGEQGVRQRDLYD